MVKIKRGISTEDSGAETYLEIHGLKVSIKIVNDRILFVDSCLNAYNYPTIGDIEKFCSKIRGYYAHADKFNELKEWYKEVNQNNNTNRVNFAHMVDEATDEAPEQPPHVLRETVENEHGETVSLDEPADVDREPTNEESRHINNIRNRYNWNTTTSTSSGTTGNLVPQA